MTVPTAPDVIRFADGAGYETFMGVWSRLVGDRFVDWLAPKCDLRWADVGCGNGAFTETIVTRCAPSAVAGVDPSDEQVAYARTRALDAAVRFDRGDAMALPWPAASFDVAVMALVLFFVPDPAVGVAEMARVVRPGGTVAAYAWDFHGGGFPYAALQDEMAAVGVPALWPPSVDASRIDVMRTLWAAAGLVDVDTATIRVARTFDDFDAYWSIAVAGSPIAPRLAASSEGDVARLAARLRERLAADADGRITCEAQANAIRGRRPT